VIGIDTLDRFLTGLVIAAALAVAGWFGLRHYGAERYQAGYNAAVDVGMKQHDREAAENRKIESDLRAELAERDAEAQRKEQEYASNLADAQRRVRAGIDRLRCPANSVQPAAAAGDRPVAGAPATDGGGPDLMPEAAADVLGYGAAIASLVSRYAEVVERFDECRAMNAK
jgi:alkanesulfonate monooxygenase SsuD/methylene tetrahydromethanopterin reductase-like flavin-dependent oxidoreductase (luciferase family)